VDLSNQLAYGVVSSASNAKYRGGIYLSISLDLSSSSVPGAPSTRCGPIPAFLMREVAAVYCVYIRTVLVRQSITYASLSSCKQRNHESHSFHICLEKWYCFQHQLSAISPIAVYPLNAVVQHCPCALKRASA
jgi:hypothetical protein